MEKIEEIMEIAEKAWLEMWEYPDAPLFPGQWPGHLEQFQSFKELFITNMKLQLEALTESNQEKIFCEDCKYICKPVGALYIPHPWSICLFPEIKEVGYVVRNKNKPACKTINVDGLCKYWKAKGGEDEN